MNDPNTWVEVYNIRVELLIRVMPMALENLENAPHQDTLRYTTISGGGYRRQVRKFAKGDYVYLQQAALITLDFTASDIILRVKEVLQSGVLVLECKDGQILKDHTCNCTTCHIQNIDGWVDFTLSVISPSLNLYKLYGRAQSVRNMILFDATYAMSYTTISSNCNM